MHFCTLLIGVSFFCVRSVFTAIDSRPRFLPFFSNTGELTHIVTMHFSLCERRTALSILIYIYLIFIERVVKKESYSKFIRNIRMGVILSIRNTSRISFSTK